MEQRRWHTLRRCLVLSTAAITAAGCVRFGFDTPAGSQRADAAADGELQVADAVADRRGPGDADQKDADQGDVDAMPAGPPALVWAASWGAAGDDVGSAVATDSSDNIYVAGVYDGPASFGGSLLPGDGSDDILVASYSHDGAHRWSKGFGDNFYLNYGHSIATSPDGFVYAAGAYAGTIDFGGGPLAVHDSGGPMWDAFVVSFTAEGSHRWSRAFGDFSHDAAWGIATDSSGDVLVTGEFIESPDFGGGPLQSAGFVNLFVLKLTSGGQHDWSDSFTVAGDSSGRGIAADDSGNVFVTGHFDGTLDFGGGPLTANGQYDVFIASLTPTGDYRWARSFGGPSDDYGSRLAADKNGNVYLVGDFVGPMSCGGPTLASQGDLDVFVASYSTDGAHRWSTSFGGSADDLGGDAAVDGQGNLYLTGGFADTADFGGGAVTSKGSEDIFLASYSTDGAHRWSLTFGAQSSDLGAGVRVDSQGNVHLTGSFQDTVDFLGKSVTSAGRADVFVLELSP